MTEPKILFFDIETSPVLAYTFGLFKTTIGLNQIVERPRVICWSARWYGEKRVKFMSEYHDDHQSMLQGLRDLLDEADIIVGYNSDSFDIPWMNEQFMTRGIPLPSPSQFVDLYKINKRYMKTPSGKLDYMAWNLLDERKVSHAGFQMWMDCLRGDDTAKARAWRDMKKYALQDTALLEPLFDKVRHWITNVNFGLYSDIEFVCTHCASENLQRRGFAYTGAGKFQRYQCLDCYGWSKDPKRYATTTLRAIA